MHSKITLFNNKGSNCEKLQPIISQKPLIIFGQLTRFTFEILEIVYALGKSLYWYLDGHCVVEYTRTLFTFLGVWKKCGCHKDVDRVIAQMVGMTEN